ncbi:MAG: threonine/serine exporter family protein, partial [Myxococcales bacterium]
MSAQPVLSLPRSAPPSPVAFALRMCRALHQHGAPSHRLEEAMLALSARLGLKGSFFSTPTAIFAAFENDGGGTEVHLLRAGSTGIDLGKLADLDALSGRVARGEVSVENGLAAITGVEASPSRYGPLFTTLCFCLNSGAAARFLGGGPREIAVALLIGLVTGLLGISGRWRAFEPVAAFAASLIAAAAAAFTGGLASHIAVLAGLIALVPGYTLTVALAELATGHLASGSARITGAFMNFLT